MIVLDTNVLAEFARQEQPDGQPLACLTSLDGEAGHTEHQQPNRHIEREFRFFRFSAIFVAGHEGVR
jgi:hypothetical protein